MSALEIHHRLIDLHSNFISRICWARVSELQSRDLAHLMHFFPEAIQSRILQLRRETDRKASALSKRLIACCLDETASAQSVFHALRYAESGRPRLDRLPSMDLSISHSGDIAVCAISHKGRVGVDIEHKRELELGDFQDIFHPEVWKTILRSPTRSDTFFEHWTILEAVAKGEGIGLAGPVRSIRASAPLVEYQGRKWQIHPLLIDPDYVGHLAIA
jgi:4'-phosphopantetheinyl transferase